LEIDNQVGHLRGESAYPVSCRRTCPSNPRNMKRNFPELHILPRGRCMRRQRRCTRSSWGSSIRRNPLTLRDRAGKKVELVTRTVPLGAHAFLPILRQQLGTFRVSQVKDGSLWPRKKIFEISPFHRARSESAGLTLKTSGKRLRRALTTSMPNQASTSSCAYFIRCSPCF